MPPSMRRGLFLSFISRRVDEFSRKFSCKREQSRTIALSQMSKTEFTRILPWRAIALLRTFVQGESRGRQTCLIGLCRAAAKRLLKTNLGGRSAERPYCRAQPKISSFTCLLKIVHIYPYNVLIGNGLQALSQHLDYVLARQHCVARVVDGAGIGHAF